MNKTISTAELFTLLQGKKGATFATVITETEPEMRKTGNPYHGSVVKRKRVNVTLNFSYANAVKKAAGKALGDLASKVKIEADIKPRTWGDRIGKSCLIMHKGVAYVEMKPNATGTTTYLQNGKKISSSLLAPWMPVKSPAAVPVMDVRINNIKQIVMDDVTYTIKD